MPHSAKLRHPAPGRHASCSAAALAAHAPRASATCTAVRSTTVPVYTPKPANCLLIWRPMSASTMPASSVVRVTAAWGCEGAGVGAWREQAVRTYVYARRALGSLWGRTQGGTRRFGAQLERLQRCRAARPRAAHRPHRRRRAAGARVGRRLITGAWGLDVCHACASSLLHVRGPGRFMAVSRSSRQCGTPATVCGRSGEWVRRRRVLRARRCVGSDAAGSRLVQQRGGGVVPAFRALHAHGQNLQICFSTLPRALP